MKRAGSRIEPGHQIKIVVDLCALGHSAGMYYTGDPTISGGHGEILGGIGFLDPDETPRVQAEYGLTPSDNSQLPF